MTATLVRELEDLPVHLRHVDTADRRGIENIGRLDLANLTHGLVLASRVWTRAMRFRPSMTILPLSQATLSLLRDTLWALGPLAARSRLVLYLHGAGLRAFRSTAPRAARAALRWLSHRTWRAVVLTPGARRQFAGLVPDSRVRVVPNSVADPGDRVYVPNRDRFRVLYLSNLIRGKGYIDLLQAASRVAAEIPELEVLLAGEWYDGREEADRLLSSPPLAGRVRVLGVVEDTTKAQVLASADLLVFPPSQTEGQPLVLLEAMAAGLPILATRSGLIPETVVEGRNAVLVPRGEPQALAVAIRSLRNDQRRRGEMARASRDLYLERYTPAHFRRSLAALLGELPQVT